MWKCAMGADCIFRLDYLGCIANIGGCVQGAVEARNRDYANIVRSLNFVSKGWYDTQVMSDDDADTRRKVRLSLSGCYCVFTAR